MTSFLQKLAVSSVENEGPARIKPHTLKQNTIIKGVIGVMEGGLGKDKILYIVNWDKKLWGDKR